jgi:WD40 repeat protein
MSWELHEDFISGLTYHADASMLLSSGGDATLCAYDIRNQKNHNRSDDQEAELQCVEVIKNGRKVICGTQEGVILFFTWGRWGDCSDRFPGHPETVDSMLKIDENTVLTGSSDGLIRVVALQPNRILGVLGDHEDFPVEGMRASRDGRILGSYAHDEVVRFWDISMFADDVDDTNDADRSGAIAPDPDDEIDETMGAETEPVPDTDDGGDDGEEDNGEWEDMNSESMSMSDDDSDDSSDDSDNEAAAGGGGRKRLPTAAEKFFADL